MSHSLSHQANKTISCLNKHELCRFIVRGFYYVVFMTLNTCHHEINSNICLVCFCSSFLVSFPNISGTFYKMKSLSSSHWLWQWGDVKPALSSGSLSLCGWWSESSRQEFIWLPPPPEHPSPDPAAAERSLRSCWMSSLVIWELERVCEPSWSLLSLPPKFLS